MTMMEEMDAAIVDEMASGLPEAHPEPLAEIATLHPELADPRHEAIA